jgi:predicted thioesterase
VPRVRSVSEQVDTGLAPGLSATVALRVGIEDTAIALRSGEVPVLGTPRLVALCEEASCRALDGHLGSGRTTVASRIQFDHLAPVAVGSDVAAEANLERVEGRRLVFTVAVRLSSEGQAGLVGAGRVTRVLVTTAKFIAKAGPPSSG